MNLKRQNSLFKDTMVSTILCLFTFNLFSVATGQLSTAEMDICSDICSKRDFMFVDYSDCLYACQDVIDQLATQDPEGIVSDPEQAINYLDNNLANPDSAQELAKRKSSFVRIGRQKSSFVRIGRSADELPEKRPSSFVRIGKSDPEFVNGELDGLAKRASSFVRIGKSSPSDDARYLFKRPSSFVRIGKKSDPMEEGLEEAKRQSHFVRIGKAMPELNEEKRASSFVRIGRPSSFVRIGKKDNGDLKRVSSFVRIGKKDESDSQADALGYNDPFSTSNFYGNDEDQKRTSSFVRIGKSYNDEMLPELGNAEKRASSFVRIGKSSPYGSKRMSNFVRIGKRSVGNVASNTAEQMVDENEAEESSQ